MIKSWQKYYDDLTLALQVCRAKEVDIKQMIACCFVKSDEAWKAVKSESEQYEFQGITEEIEFFRHVKPKFIAEIEYYRLLYHAECFMTTDEKIQKEFFEFEIIRVKRFLEKSKEFYAYYKSDKIDYDEQWFVKTAGDESELAGKLIAIERYHQFLDDTVKRFDNN